MRRGGGCGGGERGERESRRECSWVGEWERESVWVGVVRESGSEGVCVRVCVCVCVGECECVCVCEWAGGWENEDASQLVCQSVSLSVPCRLLHPVPVLGSRPRKQSRARKALPCRRVRERWLLMAFRPRLTRFESSSRFDVLR